jgi:cytochrome b involved in lipid metabolism
MSATKEFTMQDVAEHNTSSDIYMVVHDKVYDCTKFLDEHPYVFTPQICSPVRCVAQ